MDHDQAAVMGRIAELERRNIELVALRDDLLQQKFLRDQVSAYNAAHPSFTKKKEEGISLLWVAAIAMLVLTHFITSRVADSATSNAAAETARQL